MSTLPKEVASGDNREAGQRDNRLSKVSRKDTGSLASDYDEVQRFVHQKPDFTRR